MPIIVPTTNDFTARYPELAEVDAGVINAVLLLASTFIDDTWILSDQQPAILSLAAHLVALEKERIDAEEAANETPGGGGSGSVQTYLSSVKFADRSLSYSVASKQSTSSGSNTSLDRSSILAGLAATIYGQIYLMLLNRNAPKVLVV